MSKLLKKKIEIDSSTKLFIENNILTAKGKLGENSLKMHEGVKPAIEKDGLYISASKENSCIAGTFWSKSKNLIEGVEKGFEKNIIFDGVGFKAIIENNKIILHLGYSHTKEYTIPAALNLKYENQLLKIKSVDKELLGQFTQIILNSKKINSKGMGVKLDGQTVKIKRKKAK